MSKYFHKNKYTTFPLYDAERFYAQLNNIILECFIIVTLDEMPLNKFT